MTQTQRKIHFTAVNHVIARLTLESGINNQKLSVAAGFNPTFIWYVMNGKRGLTTETLTQLASHFSKVLARPLPDLILEILGIEPDGTLTDGQGGRLDAVPAHQTPGTVPLLDEVTKLSSAQVEAALAKKPDGRVKHVSATPKGLKKTKADRAADVAPSIEKAEVVMPAKSAKAKTAKPTGKKLEAKPVPVAPTPKVLAFKHKDASVYVDADPAALLAQCDDMGLKVYTWAGMSGKSQTFAVAAKGPRDLQRLTGMGMSTIYGKKMALAEDALTLTACLSFPGKLLARPLDSQGAYTEAI